MVHRKARYRRRSHRQHRHRGRHGRHRRRPVAVRAGGRQPGLRRGRGRHRHPLRELLHRLLAGRSNTALDAPVPGGQGHQRRPDRHLGLVPAERGVITAFTTRFPGLTVKTQGFEQRPVGGDHHGQGDRHREHGLPVRLPDERHAPVRRRAVRAGRLDPVRRPGRVLHRRPCGAAAGQPQQLAAQLQHDQGDRASPARMRRSLTPAWKDKLAMTSWNGQFFTGYGMANGTEAMQQLITDLKAGQPVADRRPGLAAVHGRQAGRVRRAAVQRQPGPRGRSPSRMPGSGSSSAASTPRPRTAPARRCTRSGTPTIRTGSRRA